jgi:hypothetical protein
MNPSLVISSRPVTSPGNAASNNAASRAAWPSWQSCRFPAIPAVIPAVIPCCTVVDHCAVTIAEDAKQAFDLAKVMALPEHHPLGKVPSDRMQAAEAQARQRGLSSTASTPAGPATRSPTSSSGGSSEAQGWREGRRAGEALDASSSTVHVGCHACCARVQSADVV